MNTKIYPDSKVELRGFIAKHYDAAMNAGTLGMYTDFIKRAVYDMGIHPDDRILDMGCGTGRNAKLMAGYLNQKGRITGLDISKHMEQQFLKQFKDDNRVEFIHQRIDRPFNLKKTYDKAFISFVIHGFPHDVRYTILQNAYDHLRKLGILFILDYAEFDMENMSPLLRFVFKKIECRYAFDFIKRDWKGILSANGFENMREYFYVRGYVRLLQAEKKDDDSILGKTNGGVHLKGAVELLGINPITLWYRMNQLASLTERW
jgi:ubiquinone/menaquinone biosynthesis C-methylase UbiE